jgi:CheY-like chemotaxis protein
MDENLLLAIVEIGGYPDFTSEYKAFGYRVETFNSMRKALGWLKRHPPVVVVAEFNFDPMFRDRVSNVESLLAALQKYAQNARVILLLESDRREQLAKVQLRFRIDHVIELPVDPEELRAALRP